MPSGRFVRTSIAGWWGALEVEETQYARLVRRELGQDARERRVGVLHEMDVARAAHQIAAAPLQVGDGRRTGRDAVRNALLVVAVLLHAERAPRGRTQIGRGILQDGRRRLAVHRAPCDVVRAGDTRVHGPRDGLPRRHRGELRDTRRGLEQVHLARLADDAGSVCRSARDDLVPLHGIAVGHALFTPRR
jgi:hypothetical protein